MKYSVEIGSGAMIYIPSFTKFGSATQKFMGGNTDTWRAWRCHKTTFILQKKENRLKRNEGC
jgi:hypothetical protein